METRTASVLCLFLMEFKLMEKLACAFRAQPAWRGANKPKPGFPAGIMQFIVLNPSHKSNWPGHCAESHSASWVMSTAIFLPSLRSGMSPYRVEIHAQERGNDAGWRRPPIPTTLGEGGPAHLQGNLGFADYSLIRTLLL